MIEDGKLTSWIFIKPLHGIYMKRRINDYFDKEIDYNIELQMSKGLDADELRFIAARLISKANSLEKLKKPK